MKKLITLVLSATFISSSAFAVTNQTVRCEQMANQNIPGFTFVVSKDKTPSGIEIAQYTPRNDRFEYSGAYSTLKYIQSQSATFDKVTEYLSAGQYTVKMENGVITEIALFGSFPASNPAFNYAGTYTNCAVVN